MFISDLWVLDAQFVVSVTLTIIYVGNFAKRCECSVVLCEIAIVHGYFTEDHREN
jgi:hypothetical protein